jgi:NADP-dependent 3-hydroxy acid dehydrogenase YdfG
MKTAIVTGTTLGVGRQLVKELESLGYRVIATSRQIDNIIDLKSDNVLIEQFDLTEFDQIKKFCDKYKDITLDLLVNNAAGAVNATELKNESPQDFTKSYMLNVSGPMYLSRLFIDNLEKSENPTMVFISSFAGKYFYVGQSNYCLSKRGVAGLAEMFRLELSSKKIKVTEICPASINTRETAKKPVAMNASDIVSAVTWVSSLPRHCNVNIIEMAPTESRKSC